MLPNATAGQPSPARSLCSFGLCDKPATITVTSPTAVGQRVAIYCATHAARQQELDGQLAAMFRQARGRLAESQRELDAERFALSPCIADAERLDQDMAATLGRCSADDDGPRYGLTDLGRRALALEALFGPWPTVAEASAC